MYRRRWAARARHGGTKDVYEAAVESIGKVSEHVPAAQGKNALAKLVKTRTPELEKLAAAGDKTAAKLLA